ncbi:DUF2202 domain-containing protein [Clostridium sporogenes]|uniref:ferritin-like domain-containing protein n=1 Tax=Clostridium sporogenes TaxID=1509 RepID=UPI0013D0B599|nr:ferritin family protein [Clostridium sporogenes]NFV13212.1 DUF2202 domain-containing protein [Clostridium sporogenes]
MNKEELKTIKQAIINENEGYEFYKMVSKDTNSEEAKKAFLELAEEELKHVKWLKDLFTKLKDNKMDSIDLKEIQVASPKIFAWQNLDREGASKSVSVFGIGIQMERDSVDFYKKAAKDTEVQQAKVIYEELAKWEQSHLEQFYKEYETLMEEWWSEQGFEPF